MTEIAPALAFENVGFAYRPGAWVLRGCSGALRPGTILALLGPNGCGKSTLLKVLLGALLPQEGRVVAEGPIAFVPQLFNVAFGFSVLEMVLMGRARHVPLFGGPSARDRADALAALDRLGIVELATRPFHDLSGGQRQLVVLARALVAGARTLLLDEPTSALDLRNQSLVLRWITHLAKTDGLAIAFTTHHPHHALAAADDALLMLGHGRQITGEAGAVLTEANLEQVYGVPIFRTPELSKLTRKTLPWTILG